MIESILFAASFTGAVSYVIIMGGAILGNGVTLPFPILHHFGVTFANTYISTASVMYQAYFWAEHFGIIGT